MLKSYLFTSFLCCLSGLIHAQNIDGESLESTILKHDSLLFEVGFNTCNSSTFEQLLTEDFEFYHDKAGFSDKSKFLMDFRNGLCAEQNKYRSRRKLVPESTIVTGLFNNGVLYGAIQEGEHLFYERSEGKQEQIVGSARFTHVWLFSQNEWKLSRSLSYDHHAAKENRLSNAKLLQIAQQILDKKESYAIWNLMEIDTVGMQIVTGRFTTESVETTLVLMEGVAGGSAGSSNNLLILLDASDSLKTTVIWAGQVGEFSPTDIKDLTNDGIDEVILQSDYLWMGESGATYEIVNFKNGSMGTLFSAPSSFVPDWSNEALPKLYKAGDTLEVHNACRLIPQEDGTYAIEQKTTTTICMGGKSLAELRKRMKITTETTLTRLE